MSVRFYLEDCDEALRLFNQGNNAIKDIHCIIFLRCNGKEQVLESSYQKPLVVWSSSKKTEKQNQAFFPPVAAIRCGKMDESKHIQEPWRKKQSEVTCFPLRKISTAGNISNSLRCTKPSLITHESWGSRPSKVMSYTESVSSVVATGAQFLKV